MARQISQQISALHRAVWRATVASAGIRRSDGPRDRGKVEAEYVRGKGYSRGDTWTDGPSGAAASCGVYELVGGLAHLVELLEVGERLLLAVELLPHHDL